MKMKNLKNERKEREVWNAREKRVVRLKNGMVGVGYVVSGSGWGSHPLRLYQIISSFFIF